ncbi:GLPGLI family protein [Chitinophaga agrisoli]|nr:GLPGLI family protein [Chitinophaga agrisoli]
MKKICLTFSMGLVLLSVHGQQTGGRVVYERTLQLQLFLPPGAAPQRMPPSTRKDRLEVLFGNGQCLRRAIDDELPEAMEASGGGMHLDVIAPGGGSDNETFTDFAAGKVVSQRELGGRNYVITDTIQRLNWKLTGRTSTILNYPCQQAVAQRIGIRMRPGLENGMMKMLEAPDTVTVTAWFTLSVPAPAGPEYQGQLPGLILGLEMDNGRVMYQAVELSAKTDLAAIKPPAKGKSLSAAEFAAERKKFMAAMQRNVGRGGNIRIGG